MIRRALANRPPPRVPPVIGHPAGHPTDVELPCSGLKMFLVISACSQ